MVIPAAGLGTRMKLFYPWLPKEMLPVGAKPAIHYALEEARDAGIERVIVILHRGKQIVRRYLQQQGMCVTVLYQEALTGEADAMALAETEVGNDSVAVVYPDNIYLPAPGVVRLLARVHCERQSDVVALSAVTRDNEAAVSHSGGVDLVPMDDDIFRVRRFHSKRSGHFQRRHDIELRACGIMVVGPHLFDVIRRARPGHSGDEFTDLPVRELLTQERGMLGVRPPGTVFDIGNPAGYRLCQQRIRAGGGRRDAGENGRSGSNSE